MMEGTVLSKPVHPPILFINIIMFIIIIIIIVIFISTISVKGV